jgi:hypothetical protein
MMYSPGLTVLLSEERQRSLARAARTTALAGGKQGPVPRPAADLPRPPFYFRGIAASVWRAALHRTRVASAATSPGPGRAPGPVRLCS